MPRQMNKTSKRKSQSNTSSRASKRTKTKRIDYDQDGEGNGESAAPVEGKKDIEAADSSIVGGLKGGYRITGEGDATNCYQTFEVPYKDKAIICERRDPPGTPPKRDVKGPPALIFTHGAGGGLQNPATMHFAMGFSESRPVVTFQGTMNLKSRVDTFHTVAVHERTATEAAAAGPQPAFGGRSMGARAAVMVANDVKGISTDDRDKVETLVLVSYPLVAEKSGEVRDQILKDIDEAVDVLFIIGSEDKSCDLKKLREVREAMKAKTWLCVVEGADHSMRVKRVGEEGLKGMRMRTGEIAAHWMRQRDAKKTEYELQWNDESGEAQGEWSSRR